MKTTLDNIAIIGAVCGDILGSSYEWNSTKNLKLRLITEEDRFTDDSVCTVAVADAIMNKKPMTPTLQLWCRRYPYAGYGGSFRKWIREECPRPYNSWGNGSAMRVSAAGALADSLEEALTNARLSAEVTHNHPEGIKAAEAVAAAIYLAKEGKSKEEIKDYIEESFGYDLQRDYRQIQRCYTFDVSCMGSVPESIICFLVAMSYEDTVRHAIAMGGDADTMAAIAGSIAAAFYKEIPLNIIRHCEKLLPEDMIAIINQAANRGEHNGGFSVNYSFKKDCDLMLIKAQLGIVNDKADSYGFERLKLNDIDNTITGEYAPLITRGIGCHAGVAREGKNRDFKEEISKLGRICRLSLDSNAFTLTDGRRLECHTLDYPRTLPSGWDKNDHKLFFDNVRLFIEHSEEILADSRMFLTPLYSQSFSSFFTRPTLGAALEWWLACQTHPVERNGNPICYISGSPMTGSHACTAVTPDGNIVKADLLVSFIDMLKSFGKINGRYRYLADVCETYSLQEVVNILKK